MKLLPTEAGARRRLLLMAVAVIVLGGLYYQFGGGPTYVIPQTTGPAATSKPQVTQRGASSRNAKQQGPVAPQKLHLKEMEVVPEEPESGRDPFRFGVRPTPKPTPTPTPIYTPTPIPTPTPQPGPPPIPLFLTTIIVDPNLSPKPRAYLHDKNGVTFEGVEGDTIDGRYKLIKVGTDSVVMTYVDGSGQKVIYRGG